MWLQTEKLWWLSEQAKLYIEMFYVGFLTSYYVDKMEGKLSIIDNIWLCDRMSIEYTGVFSLSF